MRRVDLYLSLEGKRGWGCQRRERGGEREGERNREREGEEEKERESAYFPHLPNLSKLPPPPWLIDHHLPLIARVRTHRRPRSEHRNVLLNAKLKHHLDSVLKEIKPALSSLIVQSVSVGRSESAFPAVKICRGEYVLVKSKTKTLRQINALYWKMG